MKRVRCTTCKRFDDTLLAHTKELEKALGLVIASCEYLHHPQAMRHKKGEPCPAEAVVRKAKGAE